MPTGGSFIIMEFIEFGRSRGDQVTIYQMFLRFNLPVYSLSLSFFLANRKKYHQSALGRKLAEMHKAAKSDKGFGFDVDNTIGR